MECREAVRSREIDERVLLRLAARIFDRDLLRVSIRDFTGLFRKNDAAGVARGGRLDARRDERCLWRNERDCLLLHVRTHERAVRVVVLDEWDERCRD